MRHLTSLLILILPFVAAAQNLSFPLHHRFVPSSSADAGETRWSHRGTVFVDLDSGTGRFEEASGTGGAVLLVGDEGEWYQVGLGESTGEDGIWPMSSTRACFLAHPSNARLTIHLCDSIPVHPTSVTFAPLNVPRSGECPAGWERGGGELPHRNSGGRLWVDVVRPEKMSGPALAGAPAVDASTGLPAAPPVEKSFLQKYWLPIAGLVLFAVSQMGPDDPRRGGGGGGAEGGR